MQLCIYQYAVQTFPEFAGKNVETGIWSFAEVNKGLVALNFVKGDLDEAMISVKNLINEILNPDIDFVEEVKVSYS